MVEKRDLRKSTENSPDLSHLGLDLVSLDKLRLLCFAVRGAHIVIDTSAPGTCHTTSKGEFSICRLTKTHPRFLNHLRYTLLAWHP